MTISSLGTPPLSFHIFLLLKHGKCWHNWTTAMTRHICLSLLFSGFYTGIVSQHSVDNGCPWLHNCTTFPTYCFFPTRRWQCSSGCCMIHRLGTTAVCRDPNQPVIQWEAHNRNGLLHYIVPHKRLQAVHDKKHGRKVALYTAIPSILCLENGQFSFCRRIHRPSWTWREAPSFLWYNYGAKFFWQKQFATGSANVQISCHCWWWILFRETAGIGLMAVPTLQPIITSCCIALHLRQTAT